MSIEVELNRKGGRICKHALAGEIHCPLIVRPTSEDVVTGNVFGMLQYVRPHLWLNPMLNHALDTNEFRQVWFKDFSIRLWERQPRFPPELLDFKEGHPEPDVVIEWENPPTTVWIEAKWRSPIAPSSSNALDNDQLTRNLRALLHCTGHVETQRLIDLPKRRPILIALFAEISAATGMDTARAGIESYTGSVGLTTWRYLANCLCNHELASTTMETGIMTRAQEYLMHKLAHRHRIDPDDGNGRFDFRN